MNSVWKPLVFAMGVAAAAPVFAGDPWISVPSTPNEAQNIVIRGGDLGPNASVRIVVEHPDRVIGDHAFVADASGNLRVDYPLIAPGSYTVKAYDANGKLIGSGNLGYFR